MAEIQTSLNNWYRWNYGGSSRRTDINQKFTTEFFTDPVKVNSFKEALIYNATTTADFYQGKKFGLMFSGGSESELLARVYKEIGKEFKAYIFRYEKDINLYDVSYAVTIAEQLNIEYQIVDFNLEKFYATDAERVSELAQVDRPRALPQLKFLDYIDEIPIAGASDPTWYRPNNDYTTKCEWLMRDWEHDVGWSKYLTAINRPGILEWFKWTPEIVIGFTKMHWFSDLINDRIYGKLGTNSTKLQGYQEAYPDMIPRIKKTGLELAEPMIVEFEEFLKRKYNGLPYRAGVDRTLNQILKLEGV